MALGPLARDPKGFGMKMRLISIVSSAAMSQVLAFFFGGLLDLTPWGNFPMWTVPVAGLAITLTFLGPVFWAVPYQNQAEPTFGQIVRGIAKQTVALITMAAVVVVLALWLGTFQVDHTKLIIYTGAFCLSGGIGSGLWAEFKVSSPTGQLTRPAR